MHTHNRGTMPMMLWQTKVHKSQSGYGRTSRSHNRTAKFHWPQLSSWQLCKWFQQSTLAIVFDKVLECTSHIRRDRSGSTPLPQMHCGVTMVAEVGPGDSMCEESMCVEASRFSRTLASEPVALSATSLNVTSGFLVRGKGAMNVLGSGAVA